MVKDLEKVHSDLKLAQEAKEKLQAELKVGCAGVVLACAINLKFSCLQFLHC